VPNILFSGFFFSLARCFVRLVSRRRLVSSCRSNDGAGEKNLRCVLYYSTNNNEKKEGNWNERTAGGRGGGWLLRRSQPVEYNYLFVMLLLVGSRSYYCSYSAVLQGSSSFLSCRAAFLTGYYVVASSGG